MFKLLTVSTVAVLSALTISATATAQDAAPTFDSDCVSTQWVIRNRGLEPFLLAAPTGEPIGMIEPGTVYEPEDNLASVIIANTVIVRPSCEVLAKPATQLPHTGTSMTLALFAAVLVAVGAAACRVGYRNVR